VVNKLDENVKYDKVADVNALGLKFRRSEENNCADAIINGLGLTLISKTPVFVFTKEERKWARGELKKRGL